MMHRLRIMVLFFLVSTNFFIVGMEQKSDKVDDISELLEKLELDQEDSCLCTKKIEGEEKLTVSEEIRRAITCSCTYCFINKLKKREWDRNHQLFSPGEEDSGLWETPLLRSCQFACFALVELLLKLKADMKLTFSNGICWSAIHFATLSIYDATNVIDLLLEKGTLINEPTKGLIDVLELVRFSNNDSHKFKVACKPGTIPLFIGCLKGNISRMKYLLSKGADVMHLIDDGENIFHCFAHFLEAYSPDKEITAEDECFKIKEILHTLIDACDSICYKTEHLERLCRYDREFRKTALLVLLIRKDKKSLLFSVPRLLVYQLILKFIKSTSEILLDMPEVYDQKKKMTCKEAPKTAGELLDLKLNWRHSLEKKSNE